MRTRISLGLTAVWLACACVQASELPHFTQPNAIWNRDVTSRPIRSNSAPMMGRLEALAATGTGSGKWGGDSQNRNSDFQIDFSFYVMHATSATATKAMIAFPSADEYYTPDCEEPASSFRFPVPTIGGIEGTDPASYSCDTDNNDCHLLVVNDDTKLLYESYFTDRADASGVHSICGLSWDLKKVYPRYGRGEHCTSADGAGFPIAPLLFNADEVWTAAHGQGDLGHAIRFVIGNARMASQKYVHPSSHGTKATSDTNSNAVPYGSQLRLKSTFNVNAFSTNESVRAILRTLQKYGMFLSDGGRIPLTAESDQFTVHKWADADVNMDSHSLFGVNPSDFDVIEAGTPMTVTYDCARIADDFIFIDGNDF
jgi:hypothetical protein